MYHKGEVKRKLHERLRQRLSCRRTTLGSVFPALLTALLISAAATALEEDRAQELNYYSDGGSTIEMVDGLRIITLRDNVQVQQGSMEISGAEARLEVDPGSDELRKVTVLGSPAQFQQQPAAGGALVEGSSDTIIYLTGNDATVEFLGSARFSQEGSTFSCERIRHALESGSTETTGPCSGTLRRLED